MALMIAARGASIGFSAVRTLTRERRGQGKTLDAETVRAREGFPSSDQ
jgi:hypothetical protein